MHSLYCSDLDENWWQQAFWVNKQIQDDRYDMSRICVCEICEFQMLWLGLFLKFTTFLQWNQVLCSIMFFQQDESLSAVKSYYSAFIITENNWKLLIISDFRLILRKSLYFDNADAYLLCTHDLLCQACHMQSKYASAFSKYTLFRKIHLKSLIINGFW